MRRWILLAAFAVLAACSKDKDIDKPAVLVPISATLKVERAWTATIGTKKSVALRLGLGLALDGGQIYAAGHKGDVAAWDLATGHQIWRVRTKAQLAGGAGVGENMVVVGSSRGDVIALNRANGKTLWRIRVNGEVLAPAAVSARLVALRTVDGKLHGLSPKDGHELWVQEQQVPRLSLRGTARPVLIGDLALCGFDNGKVVAVNINDGTVQWETTVAQPHGRTELERLVDIDSTVDVSGQDVYAVAFQGRLAMLALDTGQIWWAHDASSYRGLGLDQEALYMAAANGEVIAMRKRTGAQLWSQKALLNRRLSSLSTMDATNTIVVSDYQGYVHWLDKATGAIVARAGTGKTRISNPPIVSGNMVVVINDAGRITAFKVTPVRGAKAPQPVPAAADKDNIQAPGTARGPGEPTPAAPEAAAPSPQGNPAPAAGQAPAPAGEGVPQPPEQN